MIKEISSLKNEIIKYAYKLKDASFSKKENKLLIESEHLIEMAKDNLIEVFVLKPMKLDNKIIQYVVSKEIMEKLSSGKSPAKVIGIINSTIKPINKDSNVLVFLDNIQDPGNVGTILRSALAFGFKDIILSDDTASIFNSKVIQASQGSIFKLNVSLENKSVIKNLKEEGFTVVSTSLGANTIDINDFNQLPPKMVLIFGNEGNGISKDLLNISDSRIYIPIDNIDSLNVGVACGIVFYKIKNIDPIIR
jgi:RNA methyltransferase, TrmH family